MNIVTEKEKEGRLLDGLKTLLSLNEDDFNLVIEQLQPNSKSLDVLKFYYTTDGYEGPIDSIVQTGLEREEDQNGQYIARGYFGKQQFSMNQILKTLESQLSDFEPNSSQYIRIKKLLNSRGLEAFKSIHLNEDRSNAFILDKIFEILSDQEQFEKFLDYENNINYFSADENNIPMEEYLKYMGSFFENKDKEGNLTDKNTISTNFYIPNLDECKERYSNLLDIINMEKYANRYYDFNVRKKLTDKVLRREDEPEWTVNPKLYEAIYSKMPQNLSLEEQAMYIYCSLCKEFSYDEGYMYRDKLGKLNYSSTFSKEYLEELVPGDKITCYDFARIFSKLVNEINGDIEAVIISEAANQGHFYSGFYTDKVSVELEPININGSQDPTNDLMRAKTGLNLRGIRPISDKEKILEEAIKKVYPQVLGKEPSTIQGFLCELKQTQQEEVPNDVKTKLESFIEVMKAKEIYGNEFVQTLEGVRRSSFFGTQLDCAYLGRLEEKNNEKRYSRKLLLRQKLDKENAETLLYLVDSDTLDLSMYTNEEIINKLNSGELIYESENHKMQGIYKEVGE